MLKLASTGYRFTRYYVATAAYRLKGPPHVLLRGLAPVLVATTLAVFATGVLLLVDGPGSRDQLLLWHKVSFFADYQRGCQCNPLLSAVTAPEATTDWRFLPYLTQSTWSFPATNRVLLASPTTVTSKPFDSTVS